MKKTPTTHDKKLVLSMITGLLLLFGISIPGYSEVSIKDPTKCVQIMGDLANLQQNKIKSIFRVMQALDEADGDLGVAIDIVSEEAERQTDLAEEEHGLMHDASDSDCIY